jgi:hypothetical protein
MGAKPKQEIPPPIRVGSKKLKSKRNLSIAPKTHERASWVIEKDKNEIDAL